MKNKIIIAITIVLVFALTACGKVELNTVEARDHIKQQALAKLGLSSDTQSDLFLMEEDEGWHDIWLFDYDATFVLVAYVGDEIRGYEVKANWHYNEFYKDESQWTIKINKEVIIHKVALKDLEQGGDDNV